MGARVRLLFRRRRGLLILGAAVLFSGVATLPVRAAPVSEILLELQRRLAGLEQELRVLKTNQTTDGTRASKLSVAPFSENLLLGKKGQSVKELQDVLQREGIYRSPAHGTFDRETKESVIRLQKKYGITPAEGFVGPITRRQLMILREPEAAKISDVSSRHRCTVTPFSQIVTRGAHAPYALSLYPANERARTHLAFGVLPDGISAAFLGAPTSSEAGFEIEVAEDQPPGSFSLIVIYEEESGGAPRVTFCQFNVVVE